MAETLYSQAIAIPNPCTIPRIFGLSGVAEGGKDTAYKFIKELRPDLVVRRDAFADRLKLSAAKALGIHGPDEECIRDINEVKERGRIAIFWEDGTIVTAISGRQYLQFYGTEAHREIFDTEFWIKAVLDQSQPYFGQDPFNVLVITDVRFPNEAKAIKACGGEVWRIDRDVQIADSNHASEAGIPDELVDRIIENKGTLEEFREKIKALVCPS